MDFQILFSLAFAYGVLTLASIALFNVASIRLFDVQKLAEEDEDPKSPSRCVFELVYTGTPAVSLKKIVKNFPLVVGMSGSVVGLSWVSLCIAYVLRTGKDDSHFLGIVALATLAIYVFWLTVFTTVVSAKLHNVIQDVRLTPRNPLGT